MELFAHMVLGAFSAFIILSAVPGSSLFSWHPTCMVLAVVLWTESVISFRRPRPSLRVNIHWAMNGTAISLAIIGFLSIYRNKENDDKPHFVTYHGLAGVTTMGLVIIQTIGGNFANLSGFLAKYIPAIRPAVIKWGHRVSGALSLTAMYTTVGLALGSFWFTALVNTSLLWWGTALAVSYPYLYAVFNANFAKPGKPKVK